MGTIRATRALEGIAERKPVVFVGFPGFGMAASIAMQYLVEHVACERVAHLMIDDPAGSFMAVHGGEPVWPVSVYFCEERNVVLVHSFVSFQGAESELFKEIDALFARIDPSEIVLLESVAAADDTAHKSYVFTLDASRKEHYMKSLPALEEGVLLGVSPHLYSTYPDLLVGIFTEANMALPDSEAAASLVRTLDELFGLQINRDDLAAMTAEFERKVKSLLKKSKNAQTLKERNQMSYVG